MTTFGAGQTPVTFHPIYGPRPVLDIFRVGDTVTVRQSDREPFTAQIRLIEVKPDGSVKYFCWWADRITGSDWFWPDQVS